MSADDGATDGPDDETVPERTPVVAVPERTPVVAVPERAPVVAVPERTPVVAVPERTPVVAVPERTPVVAVAGRPNVGKSTLVNRVVGRRAAVVEEKPGVTRDRLELQAEWNGRPFVVVDTGGWLGRGDALDAKVAGQAERAVAGADVVLLVVDAAVGVTTEDEDVARVVRRAGAPVVLVANKVDNDRREVDAWEFVSLGLGDPWPVSALHGRGTGDLLDEVVSLLPPPGPARPVPGTDEGEVVAEDAAAPGGAAPPPAPGDGATSVAIVGRPNVGKSTLFNRLLGEERSVVHDLPGTTRDAIDTLLETEAGLLRFIDTAGMRRRSRTEEGTEYYAMVRALQALDRADVVLLVIDATEGVTHQDQRLAERIGASGSPVVVVLNKWEELDTETRRQVVEDTEDRLAFLGASPVVKVSARTGLGVHKILPTLATAEEAYHQRIPTGELNRALRSIQAAHAAPGARIRYGVQGATDPPTFTLFANRRLPAPYLRYVERKLREQFDIGPTPMKLRVRVGS
ncbi:MAG TPA: ribosome biogenesis GTPase Der [Acidimicrobiales bacterium]|nr:ribosome biogenesis GTPase Der [Acidimicrobiales bacterium]